MANDPLARALMGSFSTAPAGSQPRRNDALVRALMGSTLSGRPVQGGFGEVATDIGKALLAKTLMNRDDAAEAKNQEAMSAAMRGYFAKPWNNPNTPQDESLTGTDAGGIAGMRAALEPYGDTPFARQAVPHFMAADYQTKMNHAANDRKRAQEQETWQTRFEAEQDAARNLASFKAGLPDNSPETFGDPETVTGPDGKPVLVQVGNRGTVQPMEGYGPEKTGGFEGSGMTQQAANTLRDYTLKTRSGAPVTEQEKLDAAIAYQFLAKDKVQSLPDGSAVTIPGMDLSSFENPMGSPVLAPQAVADNAAGPLPPEHTVQNSTSTTAPADQIVLPKSVREARESLPNVEASAAQLTDLVGKIVNHPALSSMVGMPGSFSGTGARLFGTPIAGTPEADFQALLNQLEGQTFLQAYQGLKGGGPITDIEGQQAKQAISRLGQLGQSEESYRQAAQDLLDYTQALVDKARTAAGQELTQSATSGGVTHRYNPETGKIERIGPDQSDFQVR